MKRIIPHAEMAQRAWARLNLHRFIYGFRSKQRRIKVIPRNQCNLIQNLNPNENTWKPSSWRRRFWQIIQIMLLSYRRELKKHVRRKMNRLCRPMVALGLISWWSVHSCATGCCSAWLTRTALFIWVFWKRSSPTTSQLHRARLVSINSYET